MEENSTTSNNDEVKIDSNLKEIMKKATSSPALNEAEKKRLIEEINNNFNFDKLIQDLKSQYSLNMDKYVIFTNGKEQLYYENGEFFIISTIDSKKKRKKIKREEARNLYNEFYIMTVLNPLLKQKQEKGKITKEQVKEVVVDNKENKKDLKKEPKSKVRQEIKKQVKEEIPEEKDIQEIKELEDRLNKLKEKEKALNQKRKDQDQKERI